MGITLGRSMVAFGAVCIGVVILHAYRLKLVDDEVALAHEQLKETLLGLETTRPVLHGEPIEGFAFDHYKLIGSLLSPTVVDDRLAWLNADGAQADELRDASLDSNRLALEALELGARSTDSLYKLDWSSPPPVEHPKLGSTRSIVNLALLSGQRHLDEGHPDRAVDALLDGLQLGRDVICIPAWITEMIGTSLIPIVTEALANEEFLERFPPHQLERLANGLQQLDESLPEFSHGIEGELLMLANLARQENQPDDVHVFDPTLEFWRYGFSPRALYAEYISQVMRDREVLRGLEGEPWSVRDAELGRQQLTAEGARDSLSSGSSAKLTRIQEGNRRMTISRLRLAQAAVRFKLTGEVPTLLDPFGGELRVRKLAGKIQIESGCTADFGAPEQFVVELTLREE